MVDTYWSEVLDALSLQNSSRAFLKVYFLAITNIQPSFSQRKKLKIKFIPLESEKPVISVLFTSRRKVGSSRYGTRHHNTSVDCVHSDGVDQSIQHKE